MKSRSLQPGSNVDVLGNVATVVRVKSKKIVAVHFTGHTVDGRFGGLKGGMDALISNVKPITKAEGCRR
jgi:hypothetical protein